MAINIIEKTIVPASDLDAGVIVYVPGYAIKGPEIAYCDASNFTDVFGDKPYIFKAAQKGAVKKNSRFAGQSEKSWKYAKALVDAGLTVIYHRYKALNAIVPSADEQFTITPSPAPTVPFPKFGVRSKYFGSYYAGLYVEFKPLFRNIVSVNVYVSAPSNTVYGQLLESHMVSLNPLDSNFIGFETFNNVEFYTGTKSVVVTGAGSSATTTVTDMTSTGFDAIPFMPYFNAQPTGSLTINGGATLTANPQIDLTKDEFTIGDFETALAAPESRLFSILEDTNSYQSVSYVTTGGYFQNTAIAVKGITTARKIYANQFPVSLGDTITDTISLTELREGLVSKLALPNKLDYSFACMDIGADTYAPQGDRDIYPDSFGKLLALAGNIKSGIPAWMPIANNSNGMLTSAVATTNPVSKAMQIASFDSVGVSINPIVYKNGVGFVRMGNRTMYPNSGVLTADSFENCRTVVSTLERVCRQAADSLQIARTNPTATFREFEAMVTPTANRMLVNGDGLNSITFRKLPKTKPATIDIAIDLVLVEGIEVFNISITKALNMEN